MATSTSRWWTGLPELGPVGRQCQVEADFPSSPSNRPDVSIDAVDTDTYFIRACSVRGAAHRHRRVTRQDDYSIGQSPSGHVVLAVADGLSSSPLGHIAATVACRSALSAVSAELSQGHSPDAIDWDDVVARVSAAVSIEARRIGAVNALASDDDVAYVMATTLILAVVDAGVTRATIASLAGDSAAFILRGRQWLRLGGKAQAEGLAESRLKSWLPTRASPVIEIVDLVGVDALLLCSDGLAGVLDSAGRPAKTIAEWWHAPPGLTEFATQLSFLLKGVDDDRTAAVVWPATRVRRVAESTGTSPWYRRLTQRRPTSRR